jgi:hypothetical protein
MPTPNHEHGFQPDWELRLLVPTFNGHLYPDEVQRGAKAEWTEPDTPVLVQPAGGLRLLLGTHDSQNKEQPEVVVERQTDRWAIFLHMNGGDPVGHLYLLDDGRSFLVRDEYGEQITVLEPGQDPPRDDTCNIEPSIHSQIKANT